MRVLTPVYLLAATALVAIIKVNWFDVFTLEVLLYVMFFAQATILAYLPVAGSFEFDPPICKATIPIAFLGIFVSGMCAFEIEAMAPMFTISS
ncbi:hypothetical protein [Vibrio crassostreae]|uniref:hypothetical protein n=1 Tax=Vibrio crassostreae TaxID=246167 RepID=UPI001B30CAFA|nr:hypothetical protein [Vibrio crassostreae]